MKHFFKIVALTDEETTCYVDGALDMISAMSQDITMDNLDDLDCLEWQCTIIGLQHDCIKELFNQIRARMKLPNNVILIKAADALKVECSTTGEVIKSKPKRMYAIYMTDVVSDSCAYVVKYGDDGKPYIEIED